MMMYLMTIGIPFVLITGFLAVGLLSAARQAELVPAAAGNGELLLKPFEVARYVVACVATLAVIAAGAAWYIGNRAVPSDPVSLMLKDTFSASHPERAAAALVKMSEGKSDDVLRSMGATAAVWLPPDQISAIVESMIGISRDGNAHRLAIYIAESDAQTRRNVRIFGRLGYEYATGNIVPVDYAKAERYLGDKLVRKNATAQYYLGLVLYALDNPDRREDQGRALIKQAADAGVAKAAEKLREIGG
jgi:hypothetical protein